MTYVYTGEYQLFLRATWKIPSRSLPNPEEDDGEDMLETEEKMLGTQEEEVQLLVKLRTQTSLELNLK